MELTTEQQQAVELALIEAQRMQMGRENVGLLPLLRAVAKLDRYFVIVGRAEQIERYYGFDAETLWMWPGSREGTSVILGRVPMEHADWLKQRFGSGMMGATFVDSYLEAEHAMSDRYTDELKRRRA